MKRRKRHLWLLILSALFLGLFGYSILNTSPSDQFSILNLRLSLLTPVLILLFLFISSFFSFILNTRRGLLLGLLVISYLLLRLNGLTSPFFGILLLLLFGGIELFFIKRK
jgi:hypothetical protein